MQSRRYVLAGIASLCLLPGVGSAQTSLPSAPDAGGNLPAPRSVRQSAIIAGRKISYVVTVGAIELTDASGKPTGSVVYTSYTVPGADPAGRPVTFAMNGGPGAASVAINLGALGPKRVDGGRDGGRASDKPVSRDNPNSWLDFTDLVFLDPIGTGYSRSKLGDAETRNAFLTADSDIEYLSETVTLWLSSQSRMRSPKYLVGESYGGYRVPRMAHRLQTRLGIGLTGIVMLSPSLISPLLSENDTITPLRHAFYLANMAAANLELAGRAPTPELMAPVERYARGEFVQDFLAGRADAAATERLSKRVADYTGLDPQLVRKLDGRIDVATFLRERRRSEGKVMSFLDASVSGSDPFPASPDANYDDPLMASDAPRVQTMVDFVTGDLGWRPSGSYTAASLDINTVFARDTSDSAVTDLRKIMANDPALRVMLVHGYTDFACPYLASKTIIDQMPSAMGNRIMLKVYEGGHMFYDRIGSAERWRGDARKLYLQ